MKNTYKECDVIRLDADIKTNIILNTYINETHKTSPLEYVELLHAYYDIKSYEDRGYKFQHLYLITDDEIKEGDCFYYKEDNTIGEYGISQLKEDYRKINTFNCKKIIATDNKNFTQLGLGVHEIGEIPQSFLKEYCDKGGIDKVLVEYETDILKTNGWDVLPKINSNNEITIKQIKDSWSREEVISLLDNISGYIISNSDAISSNLNLSKWIKDNV